MTNKDVLRFLGSRVRKNREKLRMTQQELADIVGLTRVSIVNVEAGRHGIPFIKLLTLCAVFRCAPNDLLPKPPKAQTTRTFKIKWK